jgi:hypothetical protein
MSGNNIKVVCRFRPQNSLEIREGGVPIVEITDGVAVQLKVRYFSCDAPVMSYFIPRLITLAAFVFRAERLKTRLPLIRSLAWKPSNKKFLSTLSSPLSMVKFSYFVLIAKPLFIDVYFVRNHQMLLLVTMELSLPMARLDLVKPSP